MLPWLQQAPETLNPKPALAGAGARTRVSAGENPVCPGPRSIVRLTSRVDPAARVGNKSREQCQSYFKLYQAALLDAAKVFRLEGGGRRVEGGG